MTLPLHSYVVGLCRKGEQLRAEPAEYLCVVICADVCFRGPAMHSSYLWLWRRNSCKTMAIQTEPGPSSPVPAMQDWPMRAHARRSVQVVPLGQ